MNWLIYIGGWIVFGTPLEYLYNIVIQQNDALLHKDRSIEQLLASKLLMMASWTMTWIWICWKFIN